jgi:hypothetical protein
VDVGCAGPCEDDFSGGDEDGGDADHADHGFGVGLAGFGVEWMRVDDSAA